MKLFRYDLRSMLSAVVAIAMTLGILDGLANLVAYYGEYIQQEQSFESAAVLADSRGEPEKAQHWRNEAEVLSRRNRECFTHILTIVGVAIIWTLMAVIRLSFFGWLGFRSAKCSPSGNLVILEKVSGYFFKYISICTLTACIMYGCLTIAVLLTR